MSKTKKKRPLWLKTLIVVGVFIAVVLILDNIVMPLYVAADEVTVPNVVGQQRDAAFSILNNAGLEGVNKEVVYDERYEKNSVIVQNPEGGKKVKEGRRVYLVVSGGESLVQMPQLRGKSLRDARFTLEQLGLKTGEITYVSSSTPKDVIVDQSYAAGTNINKGTEINISISKGGIRGDIVVPALIGKSLSEAEAILKENELRLGKINYQPSFDFLPNTVIDQVPSEGYMLNEGDAVTLFVTRYEGEEESSEDTTGVVEETETEGL
jgi:serine/threonine-protein kinase